MAQLVLRLKLKDNLNNSDLNFTVCANSVRSSIFPEGLSEMMSACKARALDEGEMMNSSHAQSWYCWYFLLRPFTFLIKLIFWVKFQPRSDLEPFPGRKFRRRTEFDNETITKPSKIEKMRKSRKTAQTCRKSRFFDVQSTFSLCWRSKSFRCATPGSERD